MYPTVLVLLLAVTSVYPYEDATAYIDHLFVYPVSLGNRLKLSESGSEKLPDWLHYDKSSQLLKGVPSAKDRGTAVLIVHDGSEVDMFAISVVQNPRSTVAQASSSSSSVLTVCEPNEAVTVVNVLLQANLDDLSASLKSSMIEGLAEHLLMKPYHVLLKRSTNEQFDSAALVRGPGDSEGEVKSVLSWVAGCGAVKSQQMEQLENLEMSAKVGSLGKSVGYGITGWQVMSNTVKTKRRLKRAVVTATPIPSVTAGSEETTTKMTMDTVMPTATPQPPSTPPPLTTPPPPRNNKPKFTVDAASRIQNREVTLGNLLQLSLDEVLKEVVDRDGDEVKLVVEPFSGPQAHPWYSFDQESNMMKALPVNSNTIGDNIFVIKAIDSRGGVSKSSLTFQIKVNEPNREDVKQWYTVSFKDDILSSPHVIQLVWKLQDRGTTSNVDVRSFEGNAVTLTDSSSACTSDLLKKLREIIEIDLGETFGTLEFDMVTVDILGCPNTPPEINSTKLTAITGVTVKPGTLFKVRLPNDLFYDKLRLEDYDLRNLKVLLRLNGQESSDQSWLTYDSKDQSLKGLPLIDESNAVETIQYKLEAVDKKGKSSIGGEFRLSVSPVDTVSTHSFDITFDGDFFKFTNNRKSQIEMYEKIEGAFQSSLRINQFSEGSIKAEFELLFDYSETGCPDRVKRSTDYAFNKENQVRSNFIKALRPYDVKRVDFTPKGACEGDIDPISAEVKVAKPAQPEPKNTTLIIVVIVVVIVVVIIVVGIVIFCVKRKRRDHNISSDNGQIIEKGVPVVFDEELREMDKKDEDEATIQTEPLLMENKLKPPAYPNGKNTEDTPLKPGENEDYQPPTPPVSEPEEISPYK